MSPLLLIGAALAAEPSDISVTSVGAQSVQATSVGRFDPDLLLGQRLRWRLGNTPVTALANARFTIDPDGATTFEQSRVRTLGVAYSTPGLEVQVGRHALAYGGARLLDGVQVIGYPEGRRGWGFGGWAGLQADPFTTRPVVRPGVGPVVTYESSVWTGSAVGELVLGAEGFDHAGAILQATGNFAPRFFVHGRIDYLFPAGTASGLSDGIASVTWKPTDALTFDVNYNAFSSIRYQTLGALDPAVQRFVTRTNELDLQNLIEEDTVDPTIKHLVGAQVRLRPDTTGVRPLVGLSTRYRHHRDEDERFLHVSPQVGLLGLAGNRLELLADADVIYTEQSWRGSGGAVAVFDVLPDGAVLLDASARVLVDPVAYDGQLGYYADLFVDALAPTDTVVSFGASWTLEPSDAVGNDAGWAAFLRLQQWIRHRRPSTEPEPVLEAAQVDPIEERP